MPDRFWIKSAYRSRAAPLYFHDEPVGVIRQPDVYAYAALVAQAMDARVLIDVGCGNGAKLVAASGGRRTIGIDYGANVRRARAAHPERDWRSHDLESAAPLPLTPAETRGALLVCSDVIEHLVDPRPLLGSLHGLLTDAVALVLSTPDRDLAHGLADGGPPPNESHVREWTLRELVALLHEVGFVWSSVGLTRSDDHDHKPHTVLVVATADAESLRRCAACLVESSPIVVPPDRSSLPWRIRRALRLVIFGY